MKYNVRYKVLSVFLALALGGFTVWQAPILGSGAGTRADILSAGAAAASSTSSAVGAASAGSQEATATDIANTQSTGMGDAIARSLEIYDREKIDAIDEQVAAGRANPTRLLVAQDAASAAQNGFAAGASEVFKADNLSLTAIDLKDGQTVRDAVAELASKGIYAQPDFKYTTLSGATGYGMKSPASSSVANNGEGEGEGGAVASSSESASAGSSVGEGGAGTEAAEGASGVPSVAAQPSSTPEASSAASLARTSSSAEAAGSSSDEESPAGEGEADETGSSSPSPRSVEDSSDAAAESQANTDAQTSSTDGASSSSADNSKSTYSTQASRQTTVVNDKWVGLQDYLSRHKFFEAWSQAKTNGKITVAVIDSGINLTHPDLAANIDSENAFDTHTNGKLTGDKYNGGDYSTHGTGVSGVISAIPNNTIGIAGTSYNANILPISSFDPDGSAWSANIWNGLYKVYELLESGKFPNLRILNCSWGGYDYDGGMYNIMTNLKKRFDLLIVAAGGNGGTKLPVYPSDFDCTLSVTAIDDNGLEPSWADLSQAKDISAQGSNVFTTASYEVLKGAGLYANMNGTSFAAPQVSGAAALLYTLRPDLSSAQVIKLLKDTATPNVNQSIYNGSAGALDAAAAVAKLIGDNPTHEHAYNYVDATYTWAADNSTCTATARCAIDKTHVVTETVKSASKVQKKATTTSEGEIYYSATFTDTNFSFQQKFVTIPKLAASTGSSSGSVNPSSSASGSGSGSGATGSGSSSGSLSSSAAAAATQQITMWRLYNRASGEHLYTKDANERKDLTGLGWVDEGVGWTAPATGDPVYRLYNAASGDHHYTMDKNEYDTLGKIGWTQEGIGWYSAASKRVALYRLFNPNVAVGTHHYTTDKNESDTLVRLGWKYEDIAWYGL